MGPKFRKKRTIPIRNKFRGPSLLPEIGYFRADNWRKKVVHFWGWDPGSNFLGTHTTWHRFVLLDENFYKLTKLLTDSQWINFSSHRLTQPPTDLNAKVSIGGYPCADPIGTSKNTITLFFSLINRVLLSPTLCPAPGMRTHHCSDRTGSGMGWWSHTMGECCIM